MRNDQQAGASKHERLRRGAPSSVNAVRAILWIIAVTFALVALIITVTLVTESIISGDGGQPAPLLAVATLSG